MLSTTVKAIPAVALLTVIGAAAPCHAQNDISHTSPSYVYTATNPAIPEDKEASAKKID